MMHKLFFSISFIKGIIIIFSLAIAAAGLILLSGQKMGEETVMSGGVKVRSAVNAEKPPAQEEQAQAQLDYWKLRVRQEVGVAYIQWQMVNQIKKNLQEQWRLAEQAYTLAHHRYLEKMGTYVEFRDAESSFNKAEQEKLKGDVAYQNAYYQLTVLGSEESLLLAIQTKGN